MCQAVESGGTHRFEYLCPCQQSDPNGFHGRHCEPCCTVCTLEKSRAEAWPCPGPLPWRQLIEFIAVQHAREEAELG